jgi:hypothetical protein
MITKIRFYKRDINWYADLPQYIDAGGTEEDCQMICGSDDWLDILSDYKDNVILSISDNEVLSEKLILSNKDEYGATYIANEFKENVINHILWLCPVTLFVFGKYPDVIYYSL